MNLQQRKTHGLLFLSFSISLSITFPKEHYCSGL
jgi:hypothetical protein